MAIKTRLIENQALQFMVPTGRIHDRVGERLIILMAHLHVEAAILFIILMGLLLGSQVIQSIILTVLPSAEVVIQPMDLMVPSAVNQGKQLFVIKIMTDFMDCLFGMLNYAAIGFLIYGAYLEAGPYTAALLIGIVLAILRKG